MLLIPCVIANSAQPETKFPLRKVIIKSAQSAWGPDSLLGRWLLGHLSSVKTKFHFGKGIINNQCLMMLEPTFTGGDHPLEYARIIPRSVTSENGRSVEEA